MKTCGVKIFRALPEKTFKIKDSIDVSVSFRGAKLPFFCLRCLFCLSLLIHVLLCRATNDYFFIVLPGVTVLFFLPSQQSTNTNILNL